MRFTVLFLFLFLLAGSSSLAQTGSVSSGGQPIPGATVTLSQGSTSYSTVTDGTGRYAFPAVSQGSWTLTIQMFGFEPLTKQAYLASGSADAPVDFDIALKQSPLLRRLDQFAARRRSAANGEARPVGQNRPPAGLDSGGALDQQIQTELNSQQTNTESPASSTSSAGSNDTFLVSGSLSPGLAEGTQADSGPALRPGAGGFGAADDGTGGANAPGFGPSGGGRFGGGGGFGGPGGGFAGRGGFGGRGGGRPPGRRAGNQFGNRARRNQQIHGQASFTLQNSALNARPFSLNGLEQPQAAYAQSRFSVILGGPLLIPKLVKDPKTQFFLTYFGTRARTPELFAETVPTADFRNGNFSQAVQSVGTSTLPVSIFTPNTHQQFPNNTIPTNLLNPIALQLLKFYPVPNQPGTANNYQFETAQATNSDNLGLRLQRNITNLDRLSINFQYQNRSGTTAQPFGYADETEGYGVRAQLQWTRNLSATAVNNGQLRFNRNYSRIIPAFSSLPDVAQQLGIPGTSTNPLDYGPPTLNFTNFGSLSDGYATLNRNQSLGGSDSVSWLHGKHSITVGGGFTRSDLSTRSDPNGRGTFNFTGVATSELNAAGQPRGTTGFDLADFLLGLPQSTSIQFSQSNYYFQQNQWNGYAQDEWKARPNLTLILGVRYDYFSPFDEKYGRLANLDIAPGYSAVAAVTPNLPGPYTGAFPSGLINPDLNNWSPRLGLAWKLPWFKRSSIFRAGYGIYYNSQAYVQFATQLATQPPFAVASSVNTSADNILTLSRGFVNTGLQQQVTNTFAVDRNYRTPYAGTWNASLQQDFGGGFFAELGYLGTKGTRLDVRTLPNEGPSGSSLLPGNQLGNASGFTYDQSIGNSIFNALQLRLIRRFNRGISVNAYYQFAKSIDDSSTFGGAGNTVAQNWLDIAAERALSSFDVRHEFQANFVWTSPVAGPGSRITSESKTGRLLRDWQLSGGITAQTGNPLTARFLGNTQQLAQTGGTGKGRAESTGASIDSSGQFFNLDAFTTPLNGTFGNAGRNTIPGPGTFNLNVAFARSFNLSERRRLEFRVESNNVLNHVNYTNLYTVVNAVNYGLPSAAGAMRTLDAVVRFRF